MAEVLADIFSHKPNKNLSHISRVMLCNIYIYIYIYIKKDKNKKRELN